MSRRVFFLLGTNHHLPHHFEAYPSRTRWSPVHKLSKYESNRVRHTVFDPFDLGILAVMSTEEAEETQSTFGDGAGGPGAPTPLTVLEV